MSITAARSPIAAVLAACACWLASSSAAAQSRALLLEDGTAVGALRSGTRPSSWRAAPSAHGWDTGIWRAAHRGALRLQLGAAVAAPPMPSASAVVANELDLETAAGAPFAVLYCTEVDVVREDAATGRVFVRAHAPSGVVLEGAVRQRPRHVGWGNCGARASGEASYPAHWRAADSTAVARVQLTGMTYWGDGGRCARWQFRQRATGLRLERRSRRAESGGIVEDWVHYNFNGPRESLQMYAPSGESRWVREPRGLHIRLGGIGGIGAVYAIQFVQADAEHYEWIAGGGRVRGYHPADAVRWYRSRAACQRETPARTEPASSAASLSRSLRPGR